MSNIETKIKQLLEERETIINEMAEIKKAYEIRQQRIIEIAGSVKTLQELIADDNNTPSDDEVNEDAAEE